MSVRALAARIQSIAPARSCVLIYGEPGSGKESVAEALHRSGPRRDKPLVTIDCANPVPSLLEAELFGRGAPSAFERAQGGTLFLDEVGELPLELQPRLLQTLDSRRIRRAGEVEDSALDVRVVGATTRDLAMEVGRGRFREDLYYRFAAVTLVVPPLRTRIDDIPVLAAHLLRQLDADPDVHLTPDLLTTLSRHAWPGNVQELLAVLQRAVMHQEPVALGNAPDPRTRLGREQVDVNVPMRVGKQRLIAEFERVYFVTLLAETQGNISKIARRAGMDRMSIYRALTRLGLSPQPDRERD
jgi:DNA-binding NtrC family response regulator